jgi:GAF domain
VFDTRMVECIIQDARRDQPAVEPPAAEPPARADDEPVAVPPVEDEYVRLTRRHTTLLEFIETISSELELRPLLTRILRLACELIGADHGTIGLVDEKAGVIRSEAIHNMPPDELGAVMPPGVGIAGHVMVTKQPIVLDHYRQVERPSRWDSLDNPVIGMPIA